MFKVEHGWTRQSLSEVENLYYRRQMSSSASAGGAEQTATAATPFSGGDNALQIPATRTPPGGKSPLRKGVSPSAPNVLDARSRDTPTYEDFWSRLDTNKSASFARPGQGAQSVPARTYDAPRATHTPSATDAALPHRDGGDTPDARDVRPPNDTRHEIPSPPAADLPEAMRGVDPRLPTYEHTADTPHTVA